MSALDDQGRALLALLVDRLNRVVPGEPQTYIGYKEAHDALGLELLGPTYGESLKHQGLNSLADWTATEGKPAISGLIVDRGTLTPGPGYFRLFGKTEEDFEWWFEQVRLSKEFNWFPNAFDTNAPLIAFASAAKNQTVTEENTESPGDSDWSRQEVELIVDDYFEMLGKELSGEQYSKTVHRRALLLKLNARSNAAVEFKHRNISAVLAKNGFPYIDGYKPAKNYQIVLSEAIEDYLEGESKFISAMMTKASAEPLLTAELTDLSFETCLEVPPESHGDERGQQTTRSFRARKLDYARREASNRRLGKLGEDFVVAVERDRLQKAGKPELASQVSCISETLGDGLGYDVASFDIDGAERCIEVKTTNYGKETPFFLTANELQFSLAECDKFYLYRVFDFSRSPKLFVLRGSLESQCWLRPQVFLASF